MKNLFLSFVFVALGATQALSFNEYMQVGQDVNMDHYAKHNPDYKVVFRNIKDVRSAVAKAKMVDQSVVYEYNVNDFRGGIQHILAPYFVEAWALKGEHASSPIVETEVEVEKFRLYIASGRTGTIASGEYVLELELNAQLYTPEGQKVGRIEGIKYQADVNRSFVKGRQPSTALDAKNAYALIEVAAEELAEEIQDVAGYKPTFVYRLDRFLRSIF